ncbi:MAG: thioredoxin family protein [Eudoraea sp.]|nr:thioredoxin family protein [Eudoraea sp.]
MNTKVGLKVQDLIQKVVPQAMSYKAYRSLVEDLASAGDTTGEIISEALINYTQLNNRRMRRWDKTLKLNEAQIQEIQAFKGKVTWLVLTESWCGDAAPSLPVMNKIAELHSGITLRIVLRDEHLELMDHFLTAGTRSIPKLIMVDEDTHHVLGEWGSRPGKATAMVEAFKKEHGTLTAEFKEELQGWYNKDKGKDIIEDLLGLLTLKDVRDGSDL